jgi:anti-sigma regulatory factor (Ser/Thr protein kinase)
VGTELSVSSRSDELTITANGAEVRRAVEWLATTCQQRDVPQARVERLVLCLHEVLANVITHGGRTALAAPIRMLLKVRLDSECSKAGVTVTDAGMAFNPLSVPNRKLPKTLAEASASGLGLVMIRHCSDWLDYCHENGHNHLTFGARWDVQ